jgi:N-dimethylarginine dimethylaminohydrolase
MPHGTTDRMTFAMHGSQSETGAIHHLVVKHARDAFLSDEAIAQQWRQLNYVELPDYSQAVAEYDEFLSVLRRFEIELHILPRDDGVGLDSVYVRDASIVCDGGVILCNMGKVERRAEPGAQEMHLVDMGVPILGQITGEGCLEGGDVAWVGDTTLAVGRGYRTNDEGIKQLRDLVSEYIDELIVVQLPHWRGPTDVFHLMSIFSPIDSDLALVYSPLMPVSFREALLSRGIELVEVPPAEFETMGCNVLAVAPRRCMMLAGNPETRTRLERAGVEVHEFSGREICHKGGGGPTCLTRPIQRH